MNVAGERQAPIGQRLFNLDSVRAIWYKRKSTFKINRRMLILSQPDFNMLVAELHAESKK